MIFSKSGPGSGQLEKEEAAEMVARFQQVPVSRIEDIDVFGKIVQYAMDGKYFEIPVRRLIKLGSAA